MSEAIQDKHSYGVYVSKVIDELRPALVGSGLILDELQFHVSGDRYLMGVNKVVLTGHQEAGGRRVVIKASTCKSGIRDIERERRLRSLLIEKLLPTDDVFYFPDELSFIKTTKFAYVVTAFINQTASFFSLPLIEQFSLSVKLLLAYKDISGLSARDAVLMQKEFGVFDSDGYFDSFVVFKRNTLNNDPSNCQLLVELNRAEKFINEGSYLIEKFCGVLMHSDLVLHNVRINDGKIFLLDLSSFHIGNKFESWARYFNNIVMFSVDLEKMLVEFVRDEYGSDEFACLRVMRAYKLGFILDYYARMLARTDGNDHKRARERISFFTSVLQSILDDRPVSDELVREYTIKNASLESNEELKRRKEIGLYV